jgi:hypothetical protein
VLTDETDVSIGDFARCRNESISVIHEVDSSRAALFSNQCKSYQKNVADSVAPVDDSLLKPVAGSDDPSTPVVSKVVSQVDELQGQWTLVVKRKKSKSRLLDETHVLEH